MRFTVQEEVFEKLEDVCFGVVVARGIDNRHRSELIGNMLDAGIAGVRERFGDANVKELMEIAYYREAFVKLGINPNKYMCSIEALMKRILKGGEFPRINNIVDIGNAISLKYVVPIGAHALGDSSLDIEIRYANENDSFLPFGSEEREPVDTGELVYARGSSIKTRRWIWRQSDEGKITEESSDVFFPIDGFNNSNHSAVLSARDELAKALESILKCEVKVGYIDKLQNSMEL